MAKKKKDSKREDQEDEEEVSFDFNMEDFDEEAFMRKEIQQARATFITLGLAVVTAAASRALEVATGNWQVGLVALAAAVLGMRPLMTRLGYEELVSEKKSMAGNLFLLFFTWLGVWILLSNPPLA